MAASFDRGTVNVSILNQLASGVGGGVTGTAFGVLPYVHQTDLQGTWTWQVKLGGTGAVSAINVVLEGSLDGTSFSTMDTSTQTGGETRFVVDKKVLYIRARITSATVGSGAPTITVLIAA